MHRSSSAGAQTPGGEWILKEPRGPSQRLASRYWDGPIKPSAPWRLDDIFFGPCRGEHASASGNGWHILKWFSVCGIRKTVWADVRVSNVGRCQGPATLAEAIHPGTERGSPLDHRILYHQYNSCMVMSYRVYYLLSYVIEWYWLYIYNVVYLAMDIYIYIILVKPFLQKYFMT